MKLIFAQGNPGTQYARTRHNVGFMVLDALADSKQASWKKESKFNAEIASYTEVGEKILLVKPLSYYNDTGLVARSIVDFYKLNPEHDVLVIHDELALPFGEIRTREKGSDAGNNGIKSLNAYVGAHYARIRIGIWNELRARMDDADFVLSGFSATEREDLHTIIEKITPELVTQFIEGTLEMTTVRLPR